MAHSVLEARLLQALNDQVSDWAEVDPYSDDDLVWGEVAGHYVDAALEEVDA